MSQLLYRRCPKNVPNFCTQDIAFSKIEGFRQEKADSGTPAQRLDLEG
jgi:hypothetical protein